eukprot:TRINITY_DN46758_c0_g1_i1.p2 TRINITY_DN46758_c0_g1~~TRINITY_DN46758_c0_g1_i1.p2  ORF type:complete len:493 (+),score=153.40 TRINITY_DN46758_c0_g1_i1:76-1554(+)
MRAVAAAAALLPAALSAPAGDQVTTLPGWEGSPISRVFAGYVSAGADTQKGVHYDMHEHYIFIESERDPSTDPVLVWTNGGPGAASLFGLFVELGPYFLSGASMKTKGFNATGVPTLFRNEYAWTRVANVLIINSPPPVGYSFCNPAGPSGDPKSCGDWDDERTAVHNAAYLESWAAAFPEYQKNDWYLSGESYAGIYVPTLARMLLRNASSLVAPRLKGFAVGDGCVGTEVLCGEKKGPYFEVKFLGGHGQFADDLYDDIMDPAGKCPRDQLINGVQSKDCQALLDEMDKQVGGYYGYNLYDACWYQNLDLKAGWRSSQDRSFWGPPRLGESLNGYPCGGPGALDVWVKHATVKKALHVAADAQWFSGDNGAGFNYKLTEKNLMPFYKEIALNTSLRVLVYNGDTDPGINSLVTQNWTRSLGLKEKAGGWRPWTIDGKQFMGGYVTEYEGDFTYLTIRGSGHMVPEYKPRPAFSFISNWLAGKDYPAYQAP